MILKNCFFFIILIIDVETDFYFPRFFLKTDLLIEVIRIACPKYIPSIEEENERFVAVLYTLNVGLMVL